MSIEQEIKQVAMGAYYSSPKMIEFLLIENLALKTLLHEKGLMTPEEFLECRNRAEQMVKEKAEVQMREHIRNQLTSDGKSNAFSESTS